jgi:hypothetical protein
MHAKNSAASPIRKTWCFARKGHGYASSSGATGHPRASNAGFQAQTKYLPDNKRQNIFSKNFQTRISDSELKSILLERILIVFLNSATPDAMRGLFDEQTNPQGR